MKPVVRPENCDVTTNQVNGLQDDGETSCSCAQQKAQHFDLCDEADATLKRLLDLWPILVENERQQIVANAEKFLIPRTNPVPDAANLK